MYKIVETDKEVAWGKESAARSRPVCTLADEYGGRVQIINDAHCYVLLLKRADNTYTLVAWWFKEAVQAVRTLPDPE